MTVCEFPSVGPWKVVNVCTSIVTVELAWLAADWMKDCTSDGVCDTKAWVTVPDAAGAKELASVGTTGNVCAKVCPLSVVTVMRAFAGVVESNVNAGSTSTKDFTSPGEVFIASAMDT